MNAIIPCFHFVEHPQWQEKRPTGPVTWDAWCSRCGFKLEDKPFAKGPPAIEGDGRKLTYVTGVLHVGGESFASTRRIVCSQCAPVILEGSTE